MENLDLTTGKLGLCLFLSDSWHLLQFAHLALCQ